jgi:hypothetical protein
MKTKKILLAAIAALSLANFTTNFAMQKATQKMLTDLSRRTQDAIDKIGTRWDYEVDIFYEKLKDIIDKEGIDALMDFTLSLPYNKIPLLMFAFERARADYQKAKDAYLKHINKKTSEPEDVYYLYNKSFLDCEQTKFNDLSWVIKISFQKIFTPILKQTLSVLKKMSLIDLMTGMESEEDSDDYELLAKLTSDILKLQNELIKESAGAESFDRKKILEDFSESLTGKADLINYDDFYDSEYNRTNNSANNSQARHVYSALKLLKHHNLKLVELTAKSFFLDNLTGSFKRDIDVAFFALAILTHKFDKKTLFSKDMFKLESKINTEKNERMIECIGQLAARYPEKPNK